MKKYDVVVIGAGPAGYAAAMRAIDFKKKVALIEKKQLGGAGIHHGALWSKTWWELSREANMLRKHGDTLNTGSVEFSFKNVKSEVRKAVKERMEQLEHHMHNINVSIGDGLFDFIQGNARVIDTNQVSINTADGIETVWADYIILATGSKPRKLPNIPIDEEMVFTSDGLDKLESFPKSMVILGAGVIGCEFATIFSNFGHTKVHLIDKGDRILPFEDEDVVKVIERNLEAKDVLVHRNSRLIDMRKDGDMVAYTLEYTDGSKEVFRVEKALVSVGRVPNYENLFDQTIDIELDNRGIIDDRTQTSISNIYAVGDITADISLVNVGELEGRYAIERIFGKPERDLIYENISTIMFLSPEVAGVGMNEIQAREKGLEYKVVSIDYSCIPRAIAMRNTQGFIKILVTNDDSQRILGMRVVGEHASSAIQAVALLISMDRGIKELAELIHPHPSIIEGIQECGRMLLGKPMLKPAVLRNAMVCKTYTNGKYADLMVS
ncbi:dihydrolipoyl dehydrogenase family protein [Marinoscillum furvescens]|uniref:Dihydrolipoamide dehydrogenase n=1 Tax=Marinoscillum furvescens DSM 4134 TaxID=1122208 RepID=A0A3D9L147_MARFU|nr:NAD(P)/FAD-dependent oxidoreductase [Marinoscillum furvescens]RED97472.1 dihydrolipoamide dehydrogenase [Marinoscillum furvescens DSM 4134]